MPQGDPDAVTLGCPLRECAADRLQGLPPVVGPQAHVLVLGSMPGAQSLARQQYYAHPRNHVWPIVEAVFALPPGLDYAGRVAALRGAGVALWDVLGACTRHGSLDAGIAREGMEVNDIAGLLATNPGIRRLLFNGVFAETVFRSRIARARPDWPPMRRLPSTSPANAARPYAEKLQAWREALRPT